MYDYDFAGIGLVFVDEFDFDNDPYSWSIVAVWKSKNGDFYLGTDSGCSCYSPFEHYSTLEDFTGPLTAEQAIEEITSLRDGGYYKGDDSEFAEFVKGIK